MRLVVDTNILFSIIIGGRRLRRLFLATREELTLTTPTKMLREVEKLIPKAAKQIGAQPRLIKKIYNTPIKPAPMLSLLHSSLSLLVV